VTKDQAIAAIDAAAADRIGKMYQILCDGFAGTASTRALAQERFTNGLQVHIEAFHYAQTAITEKWGKS
jgi:hypothetical protein